MTRQFLLPAGTKGPSHQTRHTRAGTALATHLRQGDGSQSARPELPRAVGEALVLVEHHAAHRVRKGHEPLDLKVREQQQCWALFLACCCDAAFQG